MTTSVAVTETCDTQTPKPNFAVAWAEGKGFGHKKFYAHPSSTPEQLVELAGRTPGTSYAICQLNSSEDYRPLVNTCPGAGAYLWQHYRSMCR